MRDLTQSHGQKQSELVLALLWAKSSVGKEETHATTCHSLHRRRRRRRREAGPRPVVHDHRIRSEQP
jgi:hypothetical protein